MKKINISILLLAATLATTFFLKTAPTDAQAQGDNSNQIINDEGYGNDDAEYYNAEDDTVNVDEPSTSDKNSID